MSSPAQSWLDLAEVVIQDGAWNGSIILTGLIFNRSATPA